MRLEDALRQAGGQGGFAEIGRSYGLSQEQTEALVQAVLPEFSRRIERNTLSRGGLADMLQTLGDPQVRRALDDPQSLTSPEMRSAGIGILDQVLGSKDKSRAVAARAAASTGLSEIIIKQLLPIIAAMIMGGMAKSGGGSLGDILSKIPGMPGAGGGGALRARVRTAAGAASLPCRVAAATPPIALHRCRRRRRAGAHCLCRARRRRSIRVAAAILTATCRT